MKGLISHYKTFKRRQNNKTKPGPERDSQKKEKCNAICEFNLQLISVIF